MPIKQDHRSVDPAAVAMLKIADENEFDTSWERLESSSPSVAMANSALAAESALRAPCRVDPLGEGPTQGVCGATADTMVARNLARMAAVGSASHSDHGRKVALLLKAVATGENTDYEITNEEKLQGVAAKLGISADGLTTLELADKVADAALDCFGSQTEAPIQFAAGYMPQRLKDKLGKAETAS
ncbi:MAG: hypothetical protein R2864_00905 [Syntrophotaleaceae bacterium]